MNPNRTSGWVVGRVYGAPVVVRPATLLMLALLAYIFASSSGETTARSLSIGLILAGSLTVSVFLHELAHATVARASGRKVGEIVLTLWGGHTSFEGKDLTPGVSAVTAAAGPVANLLIAVTAYGAAATLPLGDLTVAILSYVSWSNLILAAFNALPGIPMDGGRVLESIVWAVTRRRERGMWAAAWAGRIVAIGVAVWVLGEPFLRGDRPSVYDLFVVLLVVTVLWPAATASLQFARIMLKRSGVTARAMMRQAAAVEYTASVADAEAIASATGAQEIVVLGVDGTPAGRFAVDDIAKVPADARAATSLQALTVPVPRGAAIDADAGSDVVVPELRHWWGRTDAWVVHEGDAVVGIVRLVDVAAALK